MASKSLCALRLLLQRGGSLSPKQGTQVPKQALVWCRSLLTTTTTTTTDSSSPRTTLASTGPSTRTNPNSLNSFGFAAGSSSSSSSSSSTTTRRYSDDSHSDFQTQYKPQSKIQDVAKVIENDVKSHKVFVYMKGIPEAPQCGFSNMVCRILEAYDVEFGSRNVLEDMEVRQGIKDFTSWPTIPQVFVDGEFMGGCDILMEMHKSGDLEDAIKGTGDE